MQINRQISQTHILSVSATLNLNLIQVPIQVQIDPQQDHRQLTSSQQQRAILSSTFPVPSPLHFPAQQRLRLMIVGIFCARQWQVKAHARYLRCNPQHYFLVSVHIYSSKVALRWLEREKQRHLGWFGKLMKFWISDAGRDFWAIAVRELQREYRPDDVLDVRTVKE